MKDQMASLKNFTTKTSKPNSPQLVSSLHLKSTTSLFQPLHHSSRRMTTSVAAVAPPGVHLHFSGTY
ncbi:hypothetical protein QVD17_06197 [Tagetes erecta]|uniref:Uncharacterized protein n=1 Tax=Tagetes erecta TaxID=13708 RepID=A0AAD8PC22_TARER|nr:hypothetical protein QVD17_06197 [Tagetes erecta]